MRGQVVYKIYEVMPAAIVQLLALYASSFNKVWHTLYRRKSPDGPSVKIKR